MRRRIVFSLDQSLTDSSREIICSKGMQIASSFAIRFQIFALAPDVKIFSSGTPTENGFIYCETPARKDLLKHINSASLIAIKLKYEKDSLWDGEDPRAIVCEISFRKAKTTFQVDSFYFLLKGGDSFAHSMMSGEAKKHFSRYPSEEVFSRPLDELES